MLKDSVGIIVRVITSVVVHEVVFVENLNDEIAGLRVYIEVEEFVQWCGILKNQTESTNLVCALTSPHLKSRFSTDTAFQEPPKRKLNHP